MKKLSIFAAFALFFTGAANAGFIVDFYAGATAAAGNNVVVTPGAYLNGKNISNSANAFGAVAGINIPVVRLEAEYNYMTSDAINFHAAIANGYIKLLPTPIIKPYIGLGVGTAVGGTFKGADGKFNTGGILWQGMLGLQFDIPMTPLFVDLEFRTLLADKVYTYEPTPGISKDFGFIQYDLRAKLRYVF